MAEYMTLDEYIEGLIQLKNSNPLLENSPVYYASDDEGNYYYQCWSNGTVMYIHKDNIDDYELETKYNDFEDFYESQGLDFNSKKEAKEEWNTYYIPIVIIN